MMMPEPESTQSLRQTFLDASDGARLFYRSLEPGGEVAGSVVIAHGYAEHGGRYQRLMRALARAGYASLAPDHRGHGRTATTLGLVESFDALVRDLGGYVELAKTSHPGKPVFLLGHSMGGMATLLQVIRHAPAIHGAIVIAPGIEVPEDIPKLMIRIAKLLGRLTPKLAVQPFYDPTKLSTRPEVQRETMADPLFYRGRIRARTGDEIYRAMVDVNECLQRFEAPLLLLHGDDDELVRPRASETVLAKVGSSDKTRRTFPGARHEILNETCEDDVVATIVKWLDDHADRRRPD